MLDVHPPHHAANNWRDFFIHIAAIVVGLLIAVGLEQTVEAVHQRHQRRVLREGVVADAKIYLQDVDQLILAMGANFGDLDNDGYPDFYLGTGSPVLSMPADWSMPVTRQS